MFFPVACSIERGGDRATGRWSEGAVERRNEGAMERWRDRATFRGGEKRRKSDEAKEQGNEKRRKSDEARGRYFHYNDHWSGLVLMFTSMAII